MFSSRKISRRATVAGQTVRGSLAAMVTSTLCSFAGAAFPFLDAFAIWKHKQCAKKDSWCKLICENEQKMGSEIEKRRERLMRLTRSLLRLPSLSLKCKCGLLVSYLCPKSASRKISWPSAAPCIGLSSHTLTHTHSTSRRQRQIAAHSRMSV